MLGPYKKSRGTRTTKMSSNTAKCHQIQPSSQWSPITPKMSQPSAADCHAPGLMWTASPRTGWFLATSRYPVAVCPVSDVNVNRSFTSVTCWASSPGSGPRGPVSVSVTHFRAISVWPRSGARVGVAVPDHCPLVSLSSDGSHDNWPIIWHLVGPMRRTKIHLGFRGFVVNMAQPRSPPHYPPPRTAPGSSSGFCSSSSDLSRPLSSAAHHYPGKNILVTAPNCSGNGNQ